MHESREVTQLSKEELLSLMGVYLNETFIHYGMWFTETARRNGVESALELENRVIGPYAKAVIKRLAYHLGIEIKNDIPASFLTKSREELLMLIADISKLWLAGDGIWFQAVEQAEGMDSAKAINDACWSHFAKMEAFKIKRLLDMGDRPGLEGLEQALRLRIYSSINAHSVKWDDDGIQYTMTECRVQSTRRRKGMEDYPCKSAGMVEYSQFSSAIDPRIKMECLWCPPDRLCDQDFCSWKFYLE